MKTKKIGLNIINKVLIALGKSINHQGGIGFYTADARILQLENNQMNYTNDPIESLINIGSQKINNYNKTVLALK